MVRKEGVPNGNFPCQGGEQGGEQGGSHARVVPDLALGTATADDALHNVQCSFNNRFLLYFSILV